MDKNKTIQVEVKRRKPTPKPDFSKYNTPDFGARRKRNYKQINLLA